MRYAKNDSERMFIELTELLNAGWRVVIEPAPEAKRFMGVPARAKLVPTTNRVRPAEPRSQSHRGLQAVPAYPFNRYQMKTELPRAIHLFHALVFAKLPLARLKRRQLTQRRLHGSNRQRGFRR